MPEQLEPKEARQGRKGIPVLKVLIAALILMVIAWGVAEMFGEATDPEGPAIEQSDAPGEPLDDSLAPTENAPTVEPND